MTEELSCFLKELSKASVYEACTTVGAMWRLLMNREFLLQK